MLAEVGDLLFGSRRESQERRPHAVVMAGPPGAGKSTVQSAVLGQFDVGPGEWVVVDSDKAKIELLRRDMSSGAFDRVVAAVPATPSMGWLPMNYIGLWHEESLVVAEAVFDRAVEAELPILMHGTLISSESSKQLIEKLVLASYQVTIVNVMIDRDVAKRRIRERFDYETEHAKFGGRLVPDDAVDRAWLSNGKSWPAINARHAEHQYPGQVHVVHVDGLTGEMRTTQDPP
ncbi:zeta toxin family protein [Homoserinimonas sp. A447]